MGFDVFTVVCNAFYLGVEATFFKKIEHQSAFSINLSCLERLL